MTAQRISHALQSGRRVQVRLSMNQNGRRRVLIGNVDSIQDNRISISLLSRCTQVEVVSVNVNDADAKLSII